MPFTPQAKILLERFGVPLNLVISRGLCEFSEEKSLELIEVSINSRQHFLEPIAGRAWRELKRNATEAGVHLFILSAFRSIERQADIFERKRMAGLSLEQVLAASAPPCFSEHHTGRAVDIGTSGSPSFEVEFDRTEAFFWLQDNASRFGFVMSYPLGNKAGYQYEPWHWCYTGGR